MANMLIVLGSIILTAICWGAYGPVLHEGQIDIGAMRAFVGVGVAYFFIGVLAPVSYLVARGEKGHWSISGTIWSLAAGAAGAIGALGVILALKSGGKPVYVMPLVFGGAPVINSFLTMYWSKSIKQASPIFLAGLILVITGSVTVLLSQPTAVKPAAPAATATAAPATSAAAPAATAPKTFWAGVLLSTAVVILCWGAYGPVLHKGQMKMEGSRLRPLVCVGVAYFLIGVIFPALVIAGGAEAQASFNWSGSLWSLAAGAAGAIGALGIIMAFNSGGKPIYVMPLVFGGAPVVNTMIAILSEKQVGEIGPIFYAGLLMVIAGAATVLIFAPKGAPHAAAPKPQPPEPEPPKTAAKGAA